MARKELSNREMIESLLEDDSSDSDDCYFSDSESEYTQSDGEHQESKVENKDDASEKSSESGNEMNVEADPGIPDTAVVAPYTIRAEICNACGKRYRTIFAVDTFSN